MGWILPIAGVLGVGGLGAVAWLLGPAALLGVGRSALGLLAKIPWQVYALAALVGLIAFLFISRAHAIDRAKADEAQLATICTATRDASANPKLDCKLVPQQILELGTSVATLKRSIADQNAAVAALGAKTIAQQKQAQDALGRAAQRIAEAKAASQRLAASARQRPPTGSCGPSKALAEQWQ